MVLHQCLLTKLAHYGIQGDAHRWIRSWLTLCTQRVVVDGEASDFVRVKSGVATTRSCVRATNVSLVHIFIVFCVGGSKDTTVL